jgi:hypothetical protein
MAVISAVSYLYYGEGNHECEHVCAVWGCACQ